jgi:drug/metabolite transporter (DMT)-like permease
MVGIGGLFVMGGGYFPGTIPQVLGALSVLLASVNVAGGFVITKRMLDMFKSEFGLCSVDLVGLNKSQDQLIRLNIHGCTESLPLCSREAS